MGDWIAVLDVADLPPGTVRAVDAGKRRLAVCNDRGRFYAIAHECPHAGGPLSEGDLANGCLICPVHHWPFDLKTGLSDPRLPHVRLTFFACRVADGRLYVDPAEPIPPETIVDPRSDH